MKIVDVKIGKIKVPLKRPFKTALRTVYFAEDIIVKLITQSGLIGFGSAAPTVAITGDSQDSIYHTLKNVLLPRVIGQEIASIESIMSKIHVSLVHNTSALSALDMAIYDLYAQSLNLPLYKLLGGFRNLTFTSVTISANSSDVMVADALVALEDGFSDLKLKLGLDTNFDFDRVSNVRSAVGNKIKISLDANQAWGAKEAVRLIQKIENAGLNIDFVEQPVLASRIDDLKFVTQHVMTPILADESVFTPFDAFKICAKKAADMINIKLAKAGGIYQAQKILNIAEAVGMECIMGCMLESQVAVTAAAHLAAAKKTIVRCDLDSPALLAENPVVGGVTLDGNILSLSENAAGLGIKDILNVEYF
ncbi:mandelate racemase/muconate lactonizing enzyme family protein [Pigmentibacter ruber]|uniref:mandelate racemase/muconate lactonizing enzyme family protein n=1 Tax=Pigmentibacter ruber TaxID=2683196 RepID=UPI00131DA3B4|nr:dipeptide epimerase [Pigmentibacter ruber]BFD31922.1 dipeptide epimerase [Pigmentibacter ruber]